MKPSEVTIQDIIDYKVPEMKLTDYFKPNCIMRQKDLYTSTAVIILTATIAALATCAVFLVDNDIIKAAALSIAFIGYWFVLIEPVISFKKDVSNIILMKIQNMSASEIDALAAQMPKSHIFSVFVIRRWRELNAHKMKPTFKDE